MYIIRDELQPHMDNHLSALQFKNTILKYFPRRTVDGVETWGIVIMWHSTFGVLKDNAHRRVYKQLGIKIKDLEKQDYRGLDYTYVTCANYSAPSGIVTQDDIRSYICEYTPMIYPASRDVFNSDPVSIDPATVDPEIPGSGKITDLNPDPFKGTADAYWDREGWITVSLIYRPTELSLVDNEISNSEILQKCRDVSSSEIFFSINGSNRLTFAALLDANQDIFENSIRIVARTVAVKDESFQAKNIGRYNGIASEQTRYVASANIELKFRRTVDVSIGISLPSNVSNFISLLDTKIEAITKKEEVDAEYDAAFANARPSSFRNIVKSQAKANSSYVKQMVAASNWVTPIADDDLLHVLNDGADGYFIPNEDAVVKISGMSDLPPIEFKKQFLKHLKFDYKVKEKKGHWYDVIVSIVIVIVAIVVAVWCQSCSYAMYAAIFTGASLALTGWGMYLAKNGGGTKGLSIAGKLSEIMGFVAMAFGIAAIYQSFTQQAAKEAAVEAAKKESASLAQAGITQSDIAFSGYTAADVSAAQSAAAAGGVSSTQLALQGVSAVADLGARAGFIDEDIAMYIGVASGGYSSMSSIGLQSAGTITFDSAIRSIEDGIIKFTSQPLSAIINKVSNWINTGFNMYAKMIDPGNEGLASKMQQLAILEKEVDSTSVDKIEDTYKLVTDPFGSCFEVGDKCEITYIMMTHGKNKLLMDKYYDSGYRV